MLAHAIPLTVILSDAPDAHYPALVDLSDRWNGWLNPAFDRATADRVMSAVNAAIALRTAAGEHVDDATVAFDPARQAFVLHSPVWPDEPSVCVPVVDAAGVPRWYLGGWSWSWTAAP